MPSTPHVLLVEDNPADAELTQEVLTGGGNGVCLSHVSDGEKALDFLWKRGLYADAPRPDLVLLDLNMPRRDGRSVLAEIKADTQLRQIPIVVLTSSEADGDIAQSYQLGANSYITKPIDLSGFEDVIRTVYIYWFTLAKLPM